MTNGNNVLAQGLHQEPLSESIARGNGEVKFTIGGEFEERYLDPSGYELDSGEKAISVTADDVTVTATFSRPLVKGDRIWI